MESPYVTKLQVGACYEGTQFDGDSPIFCDIYKLKVWLRLYNLGWSKVAGCLGFTTLRYDAARLTGRALRPGSVGALKNRIGFWAPL